MMVTIQVIGANILDDLGAYVKPPTCLRTVEVLKRPACLRMSEELAEQLWEVSAATVDSLLKRYRGRGVKQGK